MNRIQPSKPDRQPLFASELARAHRLAARSGAVAAGLTPAEIAEICAAHDEMLDTLVRITNVSDIAQRHLTGARKQLQAELDTARSANADLTQRNAEQSDVLALAAHDLRSPLATIASLAGIIEQLLPDDASPDLLECTADINRLATAGMDMVLSLLDGYRIADGQIVPRPASINLAEFAQSVSAAWEPAARLKNCEIAVELPASGPARLVFDHDLFRRVADNLISNAIRFSPQGGIISIRFSHQADTLIMDISDDGPGIKPGDREKLFRRFAVMSSANRSPNPASTGIGLALVARVLRILGGTITYDDHTSAGSTFSVEIPAPAAD